MHKQTSRKQYLEDAEAQAEEEIKSEKLRFKTEGPFTALNMYLQRVKR